MMILYLLCTIEIRKRSQFLETRWNRKSKSCCRLVWSSWSWHIFKKVALRRHDTSINGNNGKRTTSWKKNIRYEADTRITDLCLFLQENVLTQVSADLCFE